MNANGTLSKSKEILPISHTSPVTIVEPDGGGLSWLCSWLLPAFCYWLLCWDICAANQKLKKRKNHCSNQNQLKSDPKDHQSESNQDKKEVKLENGEKNQLLPSTDPASATAKESTLKPEPTLQTEKFKESAMDMKTGANGLKLTGKVINFWERKKVDG